MHSSLSLLFFSCSVARHRQECVCAQRARGPAGDVAVSAASRDSAPRQTVAAQLRLGESLD